jgi:Cu+-exporting ATPase
VLVKNAGALERLAHARTLVVDKTGTLTMGKPVLTAIAPTAEVGGGAFGENETLALAAAAETQSEHPLARAIVEAAQARGLTVAAAENFSATAGVGVSAVVGGKRVEVSRVEVSESASAATLARLSIDGQPAAIFEFSDVLKSTTSAAIEELRGLGLRIVIASGDRERAVRAVAERLGMEGRLGVTPESKQVFVHECQKGGVVVFAGDGLNDAPSLAAADVGIAMGAGTDAAMASAGVVLVKSDLRGIARAIYLSRAVLRVIKQNLFWAFFYNALGIPLAAGVFYPLFGWTLNPMFAGFAMCASSLTVVLNALRLGRVRLG